MHRPTTKLAGALLALALGACASTPPDDDDDDPIVLSDRIAVSALNGPIRLTTLNGTDEKVIVAGHVNVPTWDPSNPNRFVFVDDRGDDSYKLSLSDTLGNTTMLPVPYNSTWPQFSKDGWIYYFVQTGTRISYRIRPDGTQLTQLSTLGQFPTPAPDGLRYALAVDQIGIRVITIASGTATTLAGTVGAQVLVWSPDGNWIAHWSNGSVVVIKPDGTERRVVATPGGVGGIAWSKDSKWLLVANGGPIQKIELATGAVTALPVVAQYVSWKP